MTIKKKTTVAVPAAMLARYEALVATQSGVERKGAALPYTSTGGNMFSFLSMGGLALRLPEDERERFMKTYNTTLVVAHGTVMKEYVAVPDALLAKTTELRPYFAKSLTYAKALKPKSTTRAPSGGAARRATGGRATVKRSAR